MLLIFAKNIWYEYNIKELAHIKIVRSSFFMQHKISTGAIYYMKHQQQMQLNYNCYYAFINKKILIYNFYLLINNKYSVNI